MPPTLPESYQALLQIAQKWSNSLAQLPLLPSVLSSNLWEAFLQAMCRSCTLGLRRCLLPASCGTPPGWDVHVVPWCLIPVPASSLPCSHWSDAFPLTGRVWVSLVSFCCKTHTDAKKKKVFSSSLSWSQPNLFSASLLPENFKLPV